MRETASTPTWVCSPQTLSRHLMSNVMAQGKALLYASDNLSVAGESLESLLSLLC